MKELSLAERMLIEAGFPLIDKKKHPKAKDKPENKDESETDGGPGSGNWGHEGVEGKLGGSAKSGKKQPEKGVHNKDDAAYQSRYKKASNGQKALMNASIDEIRSIDSDSFGMGSKTDPEVLRSAIKKYGLDDAPKVLDSSDFDKKSKDSPLGVIYRGVEANDELGLSAKEVAEQTLYGEKTYVGSGFESSGLYFSPSKSHTELYSGEKGETLKACVSPDTESISFDDLMGLCDSSGINDPSLCALYHGYEVVTADYGGDDNYCIALTRRPLIFEKTVEKSQEGEPSNKGTTTTDEAMKSLEDIANGTKEKASSPEEKTALYSGGYFKAIGYDKKPSVLSDDDFNEAESEFPVQYRGIDAPDAYDSFTEGEYFISSGANGDGTNTTPNKAQAEKFAGESGQVIEIKLDKSAKVISDEELMPFVAKFRKAEPSDTANTQAFYHLLSDPGCIAASLGYDAIADTQTGWLNIMNRSKMIVRKKSSPNSDDNNLSTNSDISEKPIDKYEFSDTIKSKVINNDEFDGGKGSGNFGHKGVQGQTGGSAPGGSETVPTRFTTKGKSMEITSDLAIEYGKKKKATATIKQGSKIEGIYSFAGKGSKENLVVSGTLSKRFGGNPKGWAHKCGFTSVVFPNGETVDGAEVHWFEHSDVGQIKFKVKYRK